MRAEERAVAFLQIATGLGIALFWLLFFTVGLAPAHPPDGYFAFEHSFVLADCALSLTLLTAGAMLLHGQPSGRALSLACAGALTFLGLVDFGFNVRNGIYTADWAEGLSSAVVNLWCILLGVGIVIAIGTRLRSS